jgi:protein-S-isoprenylcysteine O-methyltransferase Ste14
MHRLPSDPSPRNRPGMHDDERGALIECAVWLLVGYVGTAILVVALLRLVVGETPWPLAFAFIVVGALLTLWGWRTSCRVLGSDDRSASGRHSSLAPRPRKGAER